MDAHTSSPDQPSAPIDLDEIRAKIAAYPKLAKAVEDQLAHTPMTDRQARRMLRWALAEVEPTGNVITLPVAVAS